MAKVKLDGQKLLYRLGLDETATEEDVFVALKAVCGKDDKKFEQLLLSCMYEKDWKEQRQDKIKELNKRLKYSNNFMEKKALKRELDSLYRT